MKNLEKYRTWSIAVLSVVMLALCAMKGVHGEDLQAVKWGFVGIVGLVAGRAVGTAAAGGGGIKGIASTLLTDSKPAP